MSTNQVIGQPTEPLAAGHPAGLGGSDREPAAGADPLRFALIHHNFRSCP